MRISDWSSDVCSSDLTGVPWNESSYTNPTFDRLLDEAESMPDPNVRREKMAEIEQLMQDDGPIVQTYWTKLFTFYDKRVVGFGMHPTYSVRSEEHTSELQSLMRISYAVFCLKQKQT